MVVTKISSESSETLLRKDGPFVGITLGSDSMSEVSYIECIDSRVFVFSS